MPPPLSAPCPCGSDQRFGECCQPLLTGERHAVTAEQLMRSRYTAYAVDDPDHLWRSWHPRNRPESLAPDSGVTWTGLEILDTVDGGAGDQTGEVEFRAHYQDGRRSDPSAPVVGEGTLHERSRFVVRARRWFYVDGEALG